MPNPKAPRIKRTVSETEPFLKTALRRLRQLGATADEIAAVEESWSEQSDDWNDEMRREFLHKSDAELRDALRQIRDEYPFYEEQRGQSLDVNPGSVVMGADPIGPAAAAESLLPDGAPSINSKIAALEEWVGDDKERAQLVYDAEIADCATRGETPRNTLLAKMQRVANE